MNKIVALWTHPRSISTAFERMMMEREDFKILHEPFSYFYYVEGEAATIGQQFVDPDHPRTYPEIRDYISDHAKASPVFFKDMCAHCHAPLAADAPFLKTMANTFLIRDPAKAIASYHAMNPDVSRDEIGFEQLADIFRKVTDAAGETPVVVDAGDLEDDPAGTVRAYCKALGIPFMPESLTWNTGHKEEWDIWKDWHADAAQSSGFVKNMETFEKTVENNDHLKALYDYHLPFYESVYRHRVTPVSD
jgi:hypothetical protein